MDRNDFGALEAGKTLDTLTEAEKAALKDFPTVWIPDSRYLVELANASYKERLGRDVFLTDGEYRARPIAISLFTWGLYESRATVLEEKFGGVKLEHHPRCSHGQGRLAGTGRRPGLGLLQAGRPQSQQKRRRASRHDCHGRRVLRAHRHQRG